MGVERRTLQSIQDAITHSSKQARSCLPATGSSQHLLDVLRRLGADEAYVAWPTELAEVPHHAGMAQARPSKRATTLGLRVDFDLAHRLGFQLVPDLLPRRPLPGSSGSLCPCSILSIELGQSSPVLRPLLLQDRHGPAALVKGVSCLGSHAGGNCESTRTATNSYSACYTGTSLKQIPPPSLRAELF